MSKAPKQQDEARQDLLASLNAALAETAEQLLRQREETARLKAELAQREAGSPARLAGLEHVLSTLRADLRKMTEQNDSLRAECQNAEARYRGIIDSTSWKITRPARVLIRLIRRR